MHLATVAILLRPVSHADATHRCTANQEVDPRQISIDMEQQPRSPLYRGRSASLDLPSSPHDTPVDGTSAAGPSDIAEGELSEMEQEDREEARWASWVVGMIVFGYEPFVNLCIGSGYKCKLYYGLFDSIVRVQCYYMTFSLRFVLITF